MVSNARDNADGTYAFGLDPDPNQEVWDKMNEVRFRERIKIGWEWVSLFWVIRI